MSLIHDHDAQAAQLDQWLRVAINVAHSAGQIAADYADVQQQTGSVLRMEMKDDRSPVTAADKAVNHHIRQRLEACFPDIPVVGEEDKEGAAPRGITATDVWYVDPIDGTKSFIKNTAEWCVLIGLVRNGQPVIGVVYQPMADVVYYARRGGGAWMQRGSDAPVRVSCRAPKATDGLRTIRSKNNPPSGFARKIESFATGRGEHTVDHGPGSFGLRLAAIARGEADFYVSCGESCLWDSAASEVVATEAGCAVVAVRNGDNDLRRIEYDATNSMYHRANIVCMPSAMLPEFRAFALPLLQGMAKL